MKVELTSQKGIRFEIELTEEEQENIKMDLKRNIDEILEQTDNPDTDDFLNKVKNLL